MDEQFPSLNPHFNIPNIPNSSVPISLPIIPHQTTHNQPQIPSDHMLTFFNNPLCSSSSNYTINYDQNNNPLVFPTPSVSIKAKSIVSHEVDKISGSENKANNYKVSAMRKKKSTPQRIAFHTRSDEDVLDDGFRWRKYGQKTVKNTNHPRSYYRCSDHTCSVKKQIQRLSKDSSIVVTTYEGIHNHPCESLMESLNPLLKQLQFFTRI